MVSSTKVTVSRCHWGAVTAVTAALVLVTPCVTSITLRICYLEKG